MSQRQTEARDSVSETPDPDSESTSSAHPQPKRSRISKKTVANDPEDLSASDLSEDELNLRKLFYKSYCHI